MHRPQRGRRYGQSRHRRPQPAAEPRCRRGDRQRRRPKRRGAGGSRRPLLRRRSDAHVDPDAGDIVGLVYLNAFAPDAGDSCFALAGKFAGSMLGETTLRPVPRSDGTTDLFIAVDRFHQLFCPDVPAAQAARLAVTQRPATQEALVEPSGERPLWKELPSWFLVGYACPP